MRAAALSKSTHRLLIIVLVAALYSSIAFSTMTAGSARAPETGPSIYLFSIALEPGADGITWKAVIQYRFGSERTCSGLVELNAYYAHTRSVSRSLLALPLYYVSSSVCPDVIEQLMEAPGNATAEVVVSSPEGYAVLSGFDLRGRGAGGEWRFSIEELRRYYIHEGIVVADTSKYSVFINSSGDYAIVYPRGTSQDIVRLAGRALVLVRSFIEEAIGHSPRSPVVLVLGSEDDHPLIPSGAGYSTGGVVYVKLGGSLSSLVHVVAHETVHGWFNYGLLHGDFSFQEAAAEYIALLALSKDSGLFRYAIDYVNYMEEIGEEYVRWMKVHAALRAAGQIACGRDIYFESIRLLYVDALQGNLDRSISIIDLVGLMTRIADREGCASGLRALLPLVPLAVLDSTEQWPYVNVTLLEEGARLGGGQCRSPAPPAANGEEEPPAIASKDLVGQATAWYNGVHGVDAEHYSRGDYVNAGQVQQQPTLVFVIVAAVAAAAVSALLVGGRR